MAMSAGLLVAKGICVAHGPAAMRALDCTMDAGQVWGLIGANGAGKTLLLDQLVGLALPHAGFINWNGKQAKQLAASDWSQLVSYQPAHAAHGFDATVLERLTQLPGVTTQQAAQCLDQLALLGLAHRLWSSLSDGEQQRAWLGQRLLQQSRIIGLDEPLSHQDLRHQLVIGDALQQAAQRGALVIAAIHQLDWMTRYCTHVIAVTQAGQWLKGRIEDVIDEQSLQAIYGRQFIRILANDCGSSTPRYVVI